jgi:hypothetical protein
VKPRGFVTTGRESLGELLHRANTALGFFDDWPRAEPQVPALVADPTEPKLKVLLPYKDLMEFRARYGDYVTLSEVHLFLAQARPPGTFLELEVLVQDGAIALKGTGVVSSVKLSSESGILAMAVQWRTLERDTRKLITACLRAGVARRRQGI